MTPAAFASSTVTLDGGAFLTITGDAGNSVITVSRSGLVVTVADTTGVSDIDAGDCEQAGVNAVTCTVGSQQPPSFNAALGAGDDTISLPTTASTYFSALLRGEDGADTLNGGSGNDQLNPGDDDDLDTLNGGGDAFGQGDTADFTGTMRPVTADLDGTRDDGPSGGDLVATDVEGLQGGFYVDSLTGNDGDNQINGGQVSTLVSTPVTQETLDGGGGNDTIQGQGPGDMDGGGGNDTFFAAGQTPGPQGVPNDGDDDTITGGTGTDTVSYAVFFGGLTNPIEVDLDSGTGNGIDDPDAGDPDESDTFVDDIENVVGGNGAGDKLRGNEGPNTITSREFPPANDTQVDCEGGFDTAISNDGDVVDTTTCEDDGTGPPPTLLSVDDVSLTEGDAGKTNMTFTITRSGFGTGADTTVAYDTGGGTATEGTDYDSRTGTATIGDEQDSTTVTVPVNGDLADEPDETFNLTLSNSSPGVTISDGTGEGTITNDDDPPFAFDIDDAGAVTEGDTGTVAATFDVNRTSSVGAATVKVTTANGVATAPSDYTALSGTTVSFADGESTKQVTVNVKGDAIDEPDETFTASLSAPSSKATIADGDATGTITDDDAPVDGQLSVSDNSQAEGNSGTGNSVFTVTREGPTTDAVTVQYATGDGTATAGDDYTSSSGTATIAAGDAGTTIPVPVSGDTSDEADETFLLTLSAPGTGASLGDSSGQGTITNDDTTPGDPAPVQADYNEAAQSQLTNPGGGGLIVPAGQNFGFPVGLALDQDPASADAPPTPPDTGATDFQLLTGYYDVTIVNKDTGEAVTGPFDPPLEVTIPVPASAAGVPNSQLAPRFYDASSASPTWTAIPLITSPPTLPAGQQDGYYVTGTGASRVIHILTRHLTQFSVFRAAPKPAAAGGGGAGGTTGGGTTGGGGGGTAGGGGNATLARPVFALSGAALRADKRGIVTYKLRNRNAYGLKGRVSLQTTKKVKVSAGKKRKLALGSKTFALARGTTGKIKIKLTRKGLALIKRSRSLRVTVTVAGTNPQGAKSSSKRTLTLKAAKRNKRR
ncbi:MAG TPA: Calx-beta domain-containing protein [Thermoleophilaceae bacterium]|nr:Calx-beta domain-containing protein [Thermoleophilaceae bacterium]